MPEIIRTKERVYRDDYSSDDERSSSYRRDSGGYTTVQRYRVKPSRPIAVAEVDEDRSSRRSDRLEVGTRHHLLEVDRRVERADQIERPRSALEYRDPGRTRETRTVVYERGRDLREPLSPDGWERERETDFRVERRHRDRGEPVEYERISRETEYYGPPDPLPIVVRERRLEPAPMEKYEVVRREQFVDNREGASRRDEVARYDRKEIRARDSVSDDDSDSEVIVKKERRVVRDRDHSPRHKLHLAEGALAGAGAAALITNHKEKSGGISEHRGRKVAAGAAVGALGAELLSRARSKHREKSRNRSISRSRSRSRSSSRSGHHTSLTKAIVALGVTAVAAAATGKYLSHRKKVRREEMARGRSRRRSVSSSGRSSSGGNSDAPSGAAKRGTKHRVATMAKAGAGAAAVAGLVEHLRSKSRGRSKSALRTGGVAAATGLATAAVAGIYEARKAKQDAADKSAGGRRGRSGSRHGTRSIDYEDSVDDREMGTDMIEYGRNPIPADPRGSHAEHSRSRRSSSSHSRVRDIAAGALATGAAAIGIEKYKKRQQQKDAERQRREYDRERNEAERERRRHEREGPSPEDHYYAQREYSDEYSPSPPRVSGGAYSDMANMPPQDPAQYAQQAPAEPVHVNEYAPHPAYDPVHAHPPPNNAAEYHGPAPPVNPYSFPAHREVREGENPALRAPPASPSSSRSVSPKHEETHNRTVAFAPLSPSSTRALRKSHRRGSSDPSSDRPNTLGRRRNASRSPSATSSDEIEVLPDRFDKDGRPLPGSGYSNSSAYGMEGDAVERIVHHVEDVIEGRQSWRSLLRGFMDEAAGASGGKTR